MTAGESGKFLDVMLDGRFVAAGPAGDDQLVDFNADPIFARLGETLKLQKHRFPYAAREIGTISPRSICKVRSAIASSSFGVDSVISIANWGR